MRRGKTFGDDRQALLQLARELGFAAQGGQNFSLNVEVIQEMLKVRFLSDKNSSLYCVLSNDSERKA